ncbi:hypothetical protein [Sandarakinorhabdus sp.]|uniref:hypothetical protein n=1 Tax=Sandarakinorhabdus sp. TaxID=1916663 RepID=UPI00286DAB34|nr:hypothetical protein [Sandarakinorhabdus sp.]
MASNPTAARGEATGNVTVKVAARERVVSKSSAAYVLSRGKGEAAYRLSRIIDGQAKPYSSRSGGLSKATK